MFSASQIKTNMLGVVGWRQNINPAGEQLTTAITASSSGLYFNDEHALLTFDNLKSIAPIFEDIYPEWLVATNYVIGNIIYYAADTKFYICLVNNVGLIPPDNATEWDSYSPLSVWLQEKTEASIVRALTTWIDKKFTVKTAKNLLNNNTLYRTTGAVDQLSQDLGWKVGIQLVPVRSTGVKMRIIQIAVRLLQTEAALSVSLFSALDPANAIKTEAVNYTTAGAQQWFDFAVDLDAEGAYYLTYDQTTLTSGNQAINGAYDYTHVTNGVKRADSGKYFSAVPYQLNPAHVSNGFTEFDKASYTYTDNFGLNVKLDVRCDYTDFITDQKQLFQHIISKMCAIDMLTIMANNAEARVNRNIVSIDKRVVLFEIDGDPQGRPGGLRFQFDNAVDTVMIDLDGIDKVCLTCRKRSVRFTAT